MKKKVLIPIIFLLVLSISFISAANDTVEDKAYSCLKGKVVDKCSSLSSEEAVFSLLALGQCKDDVISDSKYESNTKFTAQAILALSNMKIKTESTEEWLISQNATPDNLEWLLQIESIGETNCEITYSGSTYELDIGADKKIDSTAGSCLSLYTGNYWLKIDNDCYDNEFEISCDKSFSTNLLYKKTGSDVLYVSPDTHSASAEGTTTEKVNSFCFAEDGECDYEASLWAALVLSFKDYDISSFIPYLITMMDEDENKKYLPESFLYSLTDDFKNELLLKQSSQGYWKVFESQYYDTALALLPFQNEDTNEKTNAKTWLEGVQGSDGCWNNLRDTAFILYSVWPRAISTESDNEDCETSGFYCMSKISCLDVEGSILSGYDCMVPNICCNKEKELESCEDQDGELCSSGESCLGGKEVDSSDSTSSKICCIGGTCGIQETPECELNGGYCKTSCSSEQQLASYDCDGYDVCCVTKQKSGFPVWLIILLIILIILVLLGIIFRKKLAEVYTKIKIKYISKFGKGKSSGNINQGGPRFPPSSSSSLYPGAVQRRIVPQSALMPRRPMPSSLSTSVKPANSKTTASSKSTTSPVKTTTTKTITTKTTGKSPASVKKTTTTTTKKKEEGNELEDVLKKLREMGK